MLLLQDLKILLSADTYPSSKDRLVVASVTLFQKRGYFGVGTAEILETANAPRSSLYHHFPGGKADLACAAIAWIMDEIIGSIRTLRLEGHPPEALLAITGKGISAWLKKTEFAEGSLLATLTQEICPGEEDIRQAIGAAYRAIEAEYAQMLAVSGHETKNAKRLARNIISGLEGAMIYARACQDARIISEIVARLCNEVETV